MDQREPSPRQKFTSGYNHVPRSQVIMNISQILHILTNKQNRFWGSKIHEYIGNKNRKIQNPKAIIEQINRSETSGERKKISDLQSQ